MDRNEIGCTVVAGVLLVGGTLATGVLPSTALYQAVAGGLIVSAFALLLYCFRG